MGFIYNGVVSLLSAYKGLKLNMVEQAQIILMVY